jgi:hypothetical protein
MTPKKLDAITLAAMQDFAHIGSAEIMRRRSILQFAAKTLHLEIIDLTTRLMTAKTTLKQHEARIAGMNQVIAKR